MIARGLVYPSPAKIIFHWNWFWDSRAVLLAVHLTFFQCQSVSNESKQANCGCLTFLFNHRQTPEQKLSDWSATENHLEWLERSTLTEPQQINKSQGKSHNPAELSLGSSEVRGCIVMEVKGSEISFFSRTLLVQACLKKQRTVRVLLSVKWVGRMYQGALWESQWEWSRRGNDSCYLFEREQKQTAESRNMIENTDRAQLKRENCFLMAHAFQWRE